VCNVGSRIHSKNLNFSVRKHLHAFLKFFLCGIRLTIARKIGHEFLGVYRVILVQEEAIVGLLLSVEGYQAGYSKCSQSYGYFCSHLNYRILL